MSEGGSSWETKSFLAFKRATLARLTVVLITVYSGCCQKSYTGWVTCALGPQRGPCVLLAFLMETRTPGRPAALVGFVGTKSRASPSMHFSPALLYCPSLTIPVPLKSPVTGIRWCAGRDRKTPRRDSQYPGAEADAAGRKQQCRLRGSQLGRVTPASRLLLESAVVSWGRHYNPSFLHGSYYPFFLTDLAPENITQSNPFM